MVGAPEMHMILGISSIFNQSGTVFHAVIFILFPPFFSCIAFLHRNEKNFETETQINEVL